MKKHTLYISGLHCVSCEVLLEDKLSKISQLKKIDICHKKGHAIIEYEDELPMAKIKEIINKNNYTTVNSIADIIKQKQNPINGAKDWKQIAVLTIIGIGIVYLLSLIEISRFFPNVGNQVSYYIAFILGLIASVSTCLALVGGIVISFSSTYTLNSNGKTTMFNRLRPQLLFHLGRVGGFMLLGGLLGLLGSKINYSITFTGILTIIVAVVMLYMGLYILNIVPNITRLGFHLPKKYASKISTLQGKRHPLIPIIIGLLTFFLPCGFTQSMQLAAVASQSFWSGSLIMGFFAIGTIPVLLSLGLGSTYAQGKKFVLTKKIVGIAVIFFALFNLNSGLALTGSPFTLNSWTKAGSAKAAPVTNNVQVIKMSVDYVFKPTIFKIVKDIPVRWEINAINITGCSDEVIIPSLGITSGKLKPGLNIIEFTPQKIGTLPFSCWMGMIGGKFIVTDNLDTNSGADIVTNSIKNTSPLVSCNGSCGNSSCTINSESTQPSGCGS